MGKKPKSKAARALTNPATDSLRSVGGHNKAHATMPTKQHEEDSGVAWTTQMTQLVNKWSAKYEASVALLEEFQLLWSTYRQEFLAKEAAAAEEEAPAVAEAAEEEEEEEFGGRNPSSRMDLLQLESTFHELQRLPWQFERLLEQMDALQLEITREPFLLLLLLSMTNYEN